MPRRAKPSHRGVAIGLTVKGDSLPVTTVETIDGDGRVLSRRELLEKRIGLFFANRARNASVIVRIETVKIRGKWEVPSSIVDFFHSPKNRSGDSLKIAFLPVDLEYGYIQVYGAPEDLGAIFDVPSAFLPEWVKSFHFEMSGADSRPVHNANIHIIKDGEIVKKWHQSDDKRELYIKCPGDKSKRHKAALRYRSASTAQRELIIAQEFGYKPEYIAPIGSQWTNFNAERAQIFGVLLTALEQCGKQLATAQVKGIHHTNGILLSVDELKALQSRYDRIHKKIVMMESDATFTPKMVDIVPGIPTAPLTIA